MDDQLTIVVPAYNEQSSLDVNLPAWLAACEAHGWSLIVVDDGSTDGTLQLLRAHARHPRLRAFRHAINRGYGHALKAGLARAETMYAVTMDADGQHRIEDVPRLLEAMREGEADLVIGARVVNDSSGAYRRTGKALIRWIARRLFPVRIQDLNSGFKIYRTELVRRLLPWCPGSMAFSDVVTLLHLNLGLHVIEIPVETRPRLGGRSTINAATAVETVVEIVNVLMWFRPLKVFLPLSLVFLLLGAGWAVPFLLAGRGMSGLALLLLLTGLLLSLLGLLAEQMAALRRVDVSDLSARQIDPG